MCLNPWNYTAAKITTIVARDFNEQLGLNGGSVCNIVGQYTLDDSKKRGDWLKQWLRIQEFDALNTAFEKRPDKQATFTSADGKDKQLHYVLIDKKAEDIALMQKQTT